MAEDTAEQNVAQSNGAPAGAPNIKIPRPGAKQDVQQFLIRDPYVPIPHVDTYAARYNVVNQTYFTWWDEALRNSQANTLAMRRDGFIEEMMRHRTYPVVSLPFHLEPDDPEHPDQVSISEMAYKIISEIPRLKAMMINLLESIFYGRYGVQMQLGPRKVSGNEWNSCKYFIPINGDKFRYRFDGTPGIVLYGGDISPKASDATDQVKFLVRYQDDIVSTMFGPALFLRKRELRDRFIIHNFQGFDTDYLFEAEEGQSIFGLGLRSRLYWTWNLRTELLSWMIDALQRVGANGMLYAFYQSGNATAQQEVLQSLKMLVKDNITAFPLPPGNNQSLADIIQRIEPSPVGYDIMFQLVQHLEGVMRRTFLGQDLSSEAKPTGMGSGTANLQGDVRADVIEYDANLLAETLTSQLVKIIIRYNKWKYEGKVYSGDDLPFSLRWIFDINKGDSSQRLGDATALYQMGVPLDTDDVRKAGGFSPPKKKGQVLINHEMEAQRQQNEAGQPQFNEMNKHLGGLVQEGKKAQEMGMLNKPSSTGGGQPKTSKFNDISRFQLALNTYYDYIGLDISRFAKAGDPDDCGHEVAKSQKAGKFSPGNTCHTGSGVESTGPKKNRKKEVVKKSVSVLNDIVSHVIDPKSKPSKSSKGDHGDPSENTKKIIKHVDSMYDKAPEAKQEIDSIADSIVEEVNHGSKVIKAPLKGKERAVEKAKKDYGGDASRLKDLARNTILAPDHLHEKIIERLKEKGGDVWEFTSENNPLGYSGINTSLKTGSGLMSEIQVNSPGLIYAKEPEHLSKSLLGEKEHKNLSSKVGVPGGQGHNFYEQWRSLPLGDPSRDKIETESRLYYEHIRKRMK